MKDFMEIESGGNKSVALMDESERCKKIEKAGKLMVEESYKERMV